MSNAIVTWDWVGLFSPCQQDAPTPGATLQNSTMAGSPAMVSRSDDLHHLWRIRNSFDLQTVLIVS
jgi:hypothetical protein